jgi:hypothetical protein
LFYDLLLVLFTLSPFCFSTNQKRQMIWVDTYIPSEHQNIRLGNAGKRDGRVELQMHIRREGYAHRTLLGFLMPILMGNGLGSYARCIDGAWIA